MRWTSSPLAQAGLLLALAGLCALVSNALADPSRRLDWRGQPAAAEPILPAPPPLPEPGTPAKPGPVRPAAASGPVQPSPPPSLERFAADPARPIRELAPEDAWALHQARTPFLDARRSAEYAEGHIAGAWNVSVWEASMEGQITAFEAAAKPGSTAPLVLYCSGGDCEDSQLLASRLTALGYRNLLLYHAGFPDWVQRGRPSGRGARP